jgi:hypothetical protein
LLFLLFIYLLKFFIMGVIKRGILGGFSGRVANVIGASWKGIAYMRAQPLSVSNPRTVGQTANRKSFATAGEIARSLVNTLCPINWNGKAQKMSGYNLWIKENSSHIIDWANGDFDKIKMVLGDVPAVSITMADASVGSGELALEWDDAGVAGLFSDDPKSYASEIKKKLKACEVPDLGSSLLSDGAVSIPLDSNVEVGDEIEVYLMFYSASEDRWTESAHVTVTVSA